MHRGLRCLTSSAMLRSNCSDHDCRCRLLKLTRAGESIASLSGGFGVLRLGGQVDVVGGGHSQDVKEAGCLVFVPIINALLVLDGISTLTQVASRLARDAFTSILLPRTVLPFPFINSTSPTRGHRRCILSRRKVRTTEHTHGRIFAIIRMVPRFPNKRNTLLGFLTAGIECPRSTIGGNVRKQIDYSFIIKGSKTVSRTRIVHKMDPRLGRRTLHIVGSVPM